MTDDLDHKINHAIETLVRAAPDIGPTPAARRLQSSSAPMMRRKFAVAAAFLLTCTIAAAAYLAVDQISTSPATSVVTGPVLQQPPTGSGVEISGQRFIDGSTLEPAGAVLAPDGTVYGLSFIATQTLESIPPTYEERIVAGHQAWSAPDGSAPTQIRRGIHIGCGTVSVTTGQGPRWPTALETLANSIEATPVGVTVNVPDGWRSLGAATTSETYTATFTTTIGGQSYPIFARQAIDQPVGMFLSSPETNPVELGQDQQQRWHVAGGTTPGWNTLVTVKDTTLIELSGHAPLDALHAVLDVLQPVPVNDWLNAYVEGSQNDTMATEANAATDCEQQFTIAD